MSVLTAWAAGKFDAERIARAAGSGRSTNIVMLGAAAVALLVLAWATSTGKVGSLLDRVIDTVVGQGYQIP